MQFIVTVIFSGSSLFTLGVKNFKKWRLLRKKLLLILETPTSKISDLLQENFKDDQMVALRGAVYSENPLISPYTKSKCVYFHYEELEKIEQIEYKTTDRGKSKVKKIKYNTLTDSINHKNFYIDDYTGRIEIRPDKFQIEGKIAIDRELKRPGITYNFWETFLKPCGDKIVADITRETILPIGQQVFIVGQFYRDRKNNRYIYCQPRIKKTAIITVQNEEDTIKSLTWKSYFTLLWSIFLITTAIIIFLLWLANFVTKTF